MESVTLNIKADEKIKQSNSELESDQIEKTIVDSESKNIKVQYKKNKICAAPECSGTNITNLHLFPRSDPKRLRRWMHMLKMNTGPGFTLNNCAKGLCSLHFRDDQFLKRTKKFSTLTKDAIPSIFKKEVIDNIYKKQYSKKRIHKEIIAVVSLPTKVKARAQARVVARAQQLAETQIQLNLKTGQPKKDVKTPQPLKPTPLWITYAEALAANRKARCLTVADIVTTAAPPGGGGAKRTRTTINGRVVESSQLKYFEDDDDESGLNQHPPTIGSNVTSVGSANVELGAVSLVDCNATWTPPALATPAKTRKRPPPSVDPSTPLPRMAPLARVIPFQPIPQAALRSATITPLPAPASRPASSPLRSIYPRPPETFRRPNSSVFTFISPGPQPQPLRPTPRPLRPRTPVHHYSKPVTAQSPVCNTFYTPTALAATFQSDDIDQVIELHESIARLEAEAKALSSEMQNVTRDCADLYRRHHETQRRLNGLRPIPLSPTTTPRRGETRPRVTDEVDAGHTIVDVGSLSRSQLDIAANMVQTAEGGVPSDGPNSRFADVRRGCCVRLFAQDVLDHSPTCYEYVRRVLALPAPRDIGPRMAKARVKPETELDDDAGVDDEEGEVDAPVKKKAKKKASVATPHFDGDDVPMTSERLCELIVEQTVIPVKPLKLQARPGPRPDKSSPLAESFIADGPGDGDDESTDSAGDRTPPDLSPSIHYARPKPASLEIDNAGAIKSTTTRREDEDSRECS